MLVSLKVPNCVAPLPYNFHSRPVFKLELDLQSYNSVSSVSKVKIPDCRVSNCTNSGRKGFQLFGIPRNEKRKKFGENI
jgi:hypothetical protein